MPDRIPVDERRRVVVTGLGLACTLGIEVEEVWNALLAGRSGADLIRQFASDSLPVRFGCEVDLDRFPVDPNDEEQLAGNRTLRFGAWAADRAWQDAGLVQATFDPQRAGVCVGGGVFPDLENWVTAGFGPPGQRWTKILDAQRTRCQPASQLNLTVVSWLLSRRLGLTGPSSTVQAACTSGTQAIGQACSHIRDGEVDIMLTGGADSMMSLCSVAGFINLGALSKNPDPQAASRPFDGRRDGFVMGEGAGMIVLESLESARARGAHIYAEVIGYGSAQDSHRFTDLHPEGQGGYLSIRAALQQADVAVDQVDYINAHGTSTVQNDRVETLAIKRVFGDHAYRLAISSTKSQVGHLLCAAGGIEFLFMTLALRHGMLPPTINQEHSDPDCDLDYVPNAARAANIDVAMSTSLGFGGQTGCLIARRWNETA